MIGIPGTGVIDGPIAELADCGGISARRNINVELT